MRNLRFQATTQRVRIGSLVLAAPFMAACVSARGAFVPVDASHPASPAAEAAPVHDAGAILAPAAPPPPAPDEPAHVHDHAGGSR